MKLLADASANTKAKKTEKSVGKVRMKTLSMFPNDELCPARWIADCAKPCLTHSGLAQVYSSINEARQRKTDWYMTDRDGFLKQLRRELFNFDKLCTKQAVKGVVRLNVLSDVRWEKHEIPQEFPNLYYYDYTKLPYRFGRTPDNYDLMFSYSGAPDFQKQVDEALKTDVPMTVVFRGGFPKMFKGREVIDGDKSDLFNVKQHGKIVGLRVKGNDAKDSDSPFIVDCPPNAIAIN